jgi:hypothetical protein
MPATTKKQKRFLQAEYGRAKATPLLHTPTPL